MAIYHDILKQYWGYDTFRGIQEDIINSIGQGKDTLGLNTSGVEIPNITPVEDKNPAHHRAGDLQK